MAAGSDSDWLQYVDQPRGLEDLLWWRSNMNFDAVAHLQQIKVPVLALWGGNDFITPWADYRLKLESALAAAGNAHVVTQVFDDADHRLEIGFGENDAGEWHWFGLAPGVLETISQFVLEK
jgi:pimeloyl-ACP methyl ester carboxylesterase